MDAEQLTRGQLESEFSALARTMCFSRSTIASVFSTVGVDKIGVMISTE